jgi:triacylglycerol lipase
MVLSACGSEADAPPDPSVPIRVEQSEIPASAATLDPGSLDPGTSPSADGARAAKLGPPYPIVLMHGMAGFGKIEVGPIEVTYFGGVVEDLAKNGEAVYVTLAPPFASSQVRAQAVAKQIDQILERTGKAKVNLVAHSQGGLDARVLASPNGLAYGDRIASVTTVSTPHHGSRVADVVLGMLDHLPAKLVDDVTSALLKLLQRTAYELQTDPELRAQITGLSEKYMMEVFNPRYTDDPNVIYKSYAGRSNLRPGLFVCNGSVYANEPMKLDPLQVALLPMAMMLEDGGMKVNDGLVTVESAKWGTFEQCVPADHLKEIGLLGPEAGFFDHVSLYHNIVARLRSEGL